MNDISIDLKEVFKIMKMVLIEDDPSKYVKDLEMILKLFNELDRYDVYVRNLKPLYHPNEEYCSLRDDYHKEESTDLSIFAIELQDGYFKAPGIKGRRRIRS